VIESRISALKEELHKNGYSAYIMPLGDPHQSEYPASHWKSLGWISGFTGSAGTVMVAKTHSGLWTDSRYFIQGAQELSSSSMELHKMDQQRSPGYIDWLAENLNEGDVVIADGPMISLSQKEKFSTALAKKGIQLKITDDFIGRIWKDRPPIPEDQVFTHHINYAGKTREDKIAETRAAIQKKGASHHLITTLDDIAWLFNLRGRDVDCNPVFVSFCVIAPTTTYLFINPDKLSIEIKSELENSGVTLLPYSDLIKYLKTLGTSDTILINRATINVQLYEALSETMVVEGPLVTRHMKAIKNATEIDHFRKVHVKDGVALAHAFYWLEQTVKERSVSEYEFAAKIAECRAARPHYFGESFSAIVGYKSNGAIIHYRPELETCAAIENDGILLVDSGGQYLDGTTDITRTITLSPPPADQKNAYTRVLKGHIAIAQAVFPEGTSGGQLDTLARNSLWQDGLNYGHGTGHGVGFFLNVHEPPQGFAPGSTGRAASTQKAGMITSNEPGHYVPDNYGIRIENLILTVSSSKPGFLEFETITYFPIDTQLIDFSLLTKAEVEWLNEYHAIVKDKICPHLEGEMKTWMAEKCKPV